MTEADDREGDTAKVNEGFCEAFFRMMTEADDREGDTAQ